MPGPGSYNPPSLMGRDGAKVALHGKLESLDLKETKNKPGPGQYSPRDESSKKASPRFGLGTSNREQYYLHEKYTQSIPASSSYDPQFSSVKITARKAGFGYGERNSLTNKTFAPGPGAYDAKV